MLQFAHLVTHYQHTIVMALKLIVVMAYNGIVDIGSYRSYNYITN